MSKKQHSPKSKYEIVLEGMFGERTAGQIPMQHGIHRDIVEL